MKIKLIFMSLLFMANFTTSQGMVKIIPHMNTQIQNGDIEGVIEKVKERKESQRNSLLSKLELVKRYIEINKNYVLYGVPSLSENILNSENVRNINNLMASNEKIKETFQHLTAILNISDKSKLKKYRNKLKTKSNFNSKTTLKVDEKKTTLLERLNHLLGAGNSINIFPNFLDSGTILHWTVALGTDTQIYETLENPAYLNHLNINSLNQDNQTALDLANKLKKNDDMTEYLERIACAKTGLEVLEEQESKIK